MQGNLFGPGSADKGKKFKNNRAFALVLTACVLTIALTGYTVFKENRALKLESEQRKAEQEEELLRVNEALLNADETLEENKETTNSTASAGIFKNTKQEQKDTATKEKTEKKTNETEKKATESKNTLYMKPTSGSILRNYDAEELIYNETLAVYETHTAVDFAGDIGTPVRAVADGTIKDAGYDEMRGYFVEVEHSGKIVSCYTNLQQGITVKAGDSVKQGDTLGGIGNSSLNETLDPPHLHFEMMKGSDPLDPFTLIKK